MPRQPLSDGKKKKKQHRESQPRARAVDPPSPTRPVLAPGLRPTKEYKDDGRPETQLYWIRRAGVPELQRLAETPWYPGCPECPHCRLRRSPGYQTDAYYRSIPKMSKGLQCGLYHGEELVGGIVGQLKEGDRRDRETWARKLATERAIITTLALHPEYYDYDPGEGEEAYNFLEDRKLVHILLNNATMSPQVGVVDVYIQEHDIELKEFYETCDFEVVGRRDNYFEVTEHARCTPSPTKHVHALQMRYTLEEFSIWDLSFFEDTWIGRQLWKGTSKFYSVKWPSFWTYILGLCIVLFEMNALEYHIRACYLDAAPRTAYCRPAADE